jgi:chromosome segregation ATPase
MCRLRWLAVLPGTIVASAVVQVACAQAARSGGSANPQLLMQLQQLGSERTSLQADNARMKKELEDIRKERDALKSGQKATDLKAKASVVALEQATAQRQSTEDELKRTKDRMQELIEKFRETVQELQKIETDRDVTKQTLTGREQELKVCIDRNLALYKLNDEVLTTLDKQTVWSRVAASEPFTKIKRAQLENLVDDYKARADEQRATAENLKAAARRGPPLAPAAPPKPAPAPANAPSSQPPKADTTPAPGSTLSQAGAPPASN